MISSIRNNKPAQLALGFLFGVAFGFLLQKGGVTRFDVIVNQLLLKDFTVVKVMLSAVVVGMIGVHAMKGMGWVNLHPKSGSWGQNVPGGLIFGVGFALLGYCPGTAMGAAGQGSMDALFGGVAGIVIGSGLFAALYSWLRDRVLNRGDFGTLTLPEILRVNRWVVIAPICVGMILLLMGIEVWT